MRLLLLFALAACGDEPASPRVVVHADAASVGLARAMQTGIESAVAVEESADPAGAVSAGSAIRIGLVADLSCTDCYRIDDAPNGYVVHGSAPLGVQYGLAHALELLGFRFFHPERTFVPSAIAKAPLPAELAGATQEPEMSFRGMQLHTLHPIDPLYDFDVPGDAQLEGAKRTIDWLVKNRGNYVQWIAVDDIQTIEGRLEPWIAHNRAILEYAHARGIRAGLVIQIFGQSNLQRAWDIFDDEPPADLEPIVRERLGALFPALDFDVLSLDFGEFFAADPVAFVAAVQTVYDVTQELVPGLEVNAKIHVGNYEDTRITYMGREMLYYFLADETERPIVPWVHSVMYYTLFEDAGLAYLHEEFDEHRVFLFEKLAAGERVAYFPESAYWVAFDNSVPAYMPIYLRARWFDVHEIAARSAAAGHGSLDEHAIFSSGWEWGYWQNDVASLRLGFSIPDRYEALAEEMYAPWGADGAALASAINDLAAVQQRRLVEERLAAYLAGRDVAIDIGEGIGIVSQPTRPSFAAVRMLDAAAQAQFRTSVVEPLLAFADENDAILARIEAIGSSDPWFVEVRDGVAVTGLRTRYIQSLYSAALEPDAATAEAHLTRADELFQAARAIVASRHSALHTRLPERLLTRNTNPTLYQYGYLFNADTLCFWGREGTQAKNLVRGTNASVDDCLL
jgi:hypothetical protein